MFRDKSLISCFKYNNYRAVKRTINLSFSTKKSNLNGTDKVILFSFTFFKMQHQHFFFQISKLIISEHCVATSNFLFGF